MSCQGRIQVKVRGSLLDRCVRGDSPDVALRHTTSRSRTVVHTLPTASDNCQLSGPLLLRYEGTIAWFVTSLTFTSITVRALDGHSPISCKSYLLHLTYYNNLFLWANISCKTWQVLTVFLNTCNLLLLEFSSKLSIVSW